MRSPIPWLLTLEKNRQLWRTNPDPSYDDDIEYIIENLQNMQTVRWLAVI
ncbi:MAG TPA: hypothetical protein VF233_07260 [Nitrososphaeraceae archaeon]